MLPHLTAQPGRTSAPEPATPACRAD